jgi:uncharacterized protein (TIGR03085 family)
VTTLAQTERTALCDLALEVGEDPPTLCGEWTVKDLVVHLLIREGSPAAVGMVVAPLAGLTAAAARRVGRRDFAVLVERLRHGPPILSPYALPKVDERVNTLEFFVHHEDIRRARPTWSPRRLDDRAESTLWAMLPTPGRMLTRKAPDGVSIQNRATGATRVLKKGEPASVMVRGLPSEVALYLFGRYDHARVDLVGDDGPVDRLRRSSLGL